VSATEIGATVASGGVPAQDATGLDLSYQAQIYGSNLWRKGDFNVLSVAYANTEAGKIASIAATSRMPISGAWRLGPRLTIDHRQLSSDGSTELSFVPSVLIDYQHGQRLRIMAAGDQFGLRRLEAEADRSVAAGCWDGSDGRPIVMHGRTLTKSILFADTIKVIAKYAFVSSPYPLIISLEVHCNPEQQAIMSEIMKREFGDQLLLEPLYSDSVVLPSPEELKGKILVKVIRLAQLRFFLLPAKGHLAIGKRDGVPRVFDFEEQQDMLVQKLSIHVEHASAKFFYCPSDQRLHHFKNSMISRQSAQWVIPSFRRSPPPIKQRQYGIIASGAKLPSPTWRHYSKRHRAS